MKRLSIFSKNLPCDPCACFCIGQCMVVIRQVISAGRRYRLILAKRLERALCPRVHFKMMIFDLDEVYIGSTNLTGAGISMKSAKTRNFEAGIMTDDPVLVGSSIDHFDSVWAGFRCKDCSRKKFCGDPIV